MRSREPRDQASDARSSKNTRRGPEIRAASSRFPAMPAPVKGVKVAASRRAACVPPECEAVPEWCRAGSQSLDAERRHPRKGSCLTSRHGFRRRKVPAVRPVVDPTGGRPGRTGAPPEWAPTRPNGPGPPGPPRRQENYRLHSPAGPWGKFPQSEGRDSSHRAWVSGRWCRRGRARPARAARCRQRRRSHRGRAPRFSRPRRSSCRDRSRR